jgi:hypothetical protein
MRGSFVLNKALIDVAPAPNFSRFERPNNSVPGSMKMFGGVMVFRIIATADVAANQALPQMYPCIAYLEALFATIGRWLHIVYL